MNRNPFFLLVLVALLAATVSAGGANAATRVDAHPTVSRRAADVDLFFRDLSPYGNWFSLESYGWVWTPYDVAPGWRPYTVGTWALTDDGWTWMSTEPWGWATDHYGRWLDDPDFGWVWVPGTVWSPAWVSWRFGDGWIGWAPLPPTVGWSAGVGLDLGGLDLDEMISPAWYSFVEARYLTAQDLDRHIEVRARNETLLGATRNLTRFGERDGRIVDRGVPTQDLDRFLSRPVERRGIREAASPEELRGRRGRREVTLFRPRISGVVPGHAPRETPERWKAPTPARLRAQQDRERRELEARQARDRGTLERLHRQEQEHPPAGISRPQLERRQEAEERAFEEQSRRQSRRLDHWHEREREGRARPGRYRGRQGRPPGRG